MLYSAIGATANKIQFFNLAKGIHYVTKQLL